MPALGRAAGCLGIPGLRRSRSPAATLSSPHPLDGRDDRECYDVMMAERNALVAAKRETEDELVKGIIKLSSGALLLVPGIAVSSEIRIDPHLAVALVLLGLFFFAGALLAGVVEQRLSSVAYDKQIEVTVSYYQKKTIETHDEKSSRHVKIALVTTFVLFCSAVTISAAGLCYTAWSRQMSDKPSSPPPRPTPPPSPSHPGYKDGGRSVPPSAPPPPPPKK